MCLESETACAYVAFGAQLVAFYTCELMHAEAEAEDSEGYVPTFATLGHLANHRAAGSSHLIASLRLAL